MRKAIYWDGTQFLPVDENSTIKLTGDITGEGYDTFATALKTSGVTAGSYGSGSAVPVLTIDSNGRVTAASTSVVDFPTGLTSGSTSTGFINYNGTTAASGQFDGGTTTPTGTTRLNYGGYFYPTRLNLIASADTTTAATNYFVETGSDGFVRPKTLANVKTEIVTTAAVNAAAATTVGTITSGVWNGTTIAVANGGTGATTFTSGNVLIGAGTGAITTLSRSGIDSRTTFPTATLTAGNGITGTAFNGQAGQTWSITSHTGTAGSIGTINVGATTLGVNLGTTSTTAAAGNHTHSYLPLDGSTTGTAIKIARDGASADNYGAIGVTRGTASNFSYYSLTRAGQIAWNLGVNTSNAFHIGTGTSGLDGIITSKMTLDSSGNFVAVGNVTAYSDERLKSNVATITNALEKVKAIRGVEFDKDGKHNIGVIAQEVQKIVPEVVLEGEYLSVAYGNMVGLLIEAIKEQQTQIEELKALVGK